MKNNKMAIGFLLLLTLGVSLPGCSRKEPVFVEEEPKLEEVLTTAPEEAFPLEPETIWVDICGEVEKPGVYELSKGSRLYELIEYAGGFTEAAEAKSVNQARVLTDGEQIRILSREEYEEGNAAEALAGEETSGEDRVNLNQATEEELTRLNGIGKSKAAAIVAYRKEHGPFAAIEELKEVSGIGDSTFEKIKDDIIVS